MLPCWPFSALDCKEVKIAEYVRFQIQYAIPLYAIIATPMRIYLDNCCCNRPCDEQTQLGIRLETEAKLRIQQLMQTGVVEGAI